MPRTGRTVFLDEEDLHYLEQVVERTGRSLSTLIREAVKEWIRRERNEQN